MADIKQQASFNLNSRDADGDHNNRNDGEDGTIDHTALARITKTSSIVTVLVAGLALFSDGYNAQIIG